MNNRVQYGNLLARYYLQTQVRDELKAFTQGFHEVIPQHVLQAFDPPEELDLIMGGTPFIDT